MSRCIGLAAALVLGLGGCASGPGDHRPAVDLPETWHQTVEAPHRTIDLDWWRAFGDPVLDSLVAEALAGNHDLRQAAARLEAYAARVGVVRAAGLPRIDHALRGERARGTADRYALGLQAAWEVDLWGRIRRATEAARADLLASESSFRALMLSLASAVASGYVQLRNLDHQLAIARETLARRAESVRLFELQYRGGVISRLELAQVRSEYEQAAVRIPQLERQIALQEHALSVLLGRNPGPIPRGRAVSELTLPPLPAGLPSEVVLRRPDVMAAEQRLIAASARIGEARARFFPRITLTGSIGQTGAALSGLLDPANAAWQVGASALGPIFSGGALESEVAVSEAVRREALEAWLQTVRTALREVEDALASVRERRREVLARERQIEALRIYLEKARLRYQEGYVGYLEVLDAERRLFDAELLDAQARADLYAAMVGLYKAMGGGWPAWAGETAGPSAR